MAARRDKDRNREERREEAKPRMSTFFVPGTGIDREVITSDICRYLGNDALVKPGPYQDPRSGEVRQGYFVTAYRALTTEQLADLKADSLRWQQERLKNPQASRAPSGDGYRGSATRRLQWGSSEQTTEPAYGNRDPRDTRDALPPRVEPQQPYPGQVPQYSGNPGMMPQTGRYPGAAQDPYQPMDAPNSGFYDANARNAGRGVAANYGVDTQSARTPYNAGYSMSDPQVLRGPPPAQPYPGNTYATNTEYSGINSPPLTGGPRAQPTGYDAYGREQPPDPRYGRTISDFADQPAAQPAPEGEFANDQYHEDDPMEEDEEEDYPPRRDARTQQAARTREGERVRTPPTAKSGRSHREHGDHDGRRRK